MADRYSKRKIQSSTITTVISLSLVLFMLGLLGLLVLSAKKLSDHFKENIGFQIYLNDNAKEVDINKFQKTLDAKQYVKSTEFISKEKAMELYKQDVGEDFVQFIGYNPLPSSIDLRLSASYANADSINWIKKEIIENQVVKEFDYKESLVDLINSRVNTISLFFLLFTGLLMIIALALINNTIRLAIYSKRFLIRTMQLVGATSGFISRPFIFNGILQGIYGSIIAIGLLIGLIYLAMQEVPDLLVVLDSSLFLSLFGLVILMGIVISWASTSMAVRKYLRMKQSELYY
jgi:cell division transport system permease protein